MWNSAPKKAPAKEQALAIPDMVSARCGLILRPHIKLLAIFTKGVWRRPETTSSILLLEVVIAVLVQVEVTIFLAVAEVVLIDWPPTQPHRGRRPPRCEIY